MADRVSGNPQDQQSKRELWRWLLLVPLAFLLLLGCGLLAQIGIARQAAPDTRSKLQADYRAWPLVIIPAINDVWGDQPLRFQEGLRRRRDSLLVSAVLEEPLRHRQRLDRRGGVQLVRLRLLEQGGDLEDAIVEPGVGRCEPLQRGLSFLEN